MIAFLEENADAIARDVANSIGRPLHLANELPRLRAATEQLIKDAEQVFKPVSYPSDDGIRRFTTRQSKGVILSICAWNYPVAMPANLVVAPLLAGNTLIFKHAPQTAIIGDWFHEASKQADLPEGVFNVVSAEHEDVEKLLNEGLVNALEFIGSTRGGFALRQAAASQPIELGLEMGGNDACYVRGDADLETAAREIVSGGFGNSGQSCCSVERVYIHEAVHDEFLELLAKSARDLKLGHPHEVSTNLGPVAFSHAASQLRQRISTAIEKGAVPLLPHQNPPNVADQSAYVSPQILSGVTHEMSIVGEEVFGPVVYAIKVFDDDEAIRLMNESEYGLTASIWSQNTSLALEMGKKLKCGTFYVNKCDYADLYLPWGGIGMSGMGRINGGIIGFDKLTEIKSFVVDPVLP
jgi:acyl-CoA reductase-like NAD-dependent aldehyde dehydrogenase